jgi:plasmid stabilization system protein ParE
MAELIVLNGAENDSLEIYFRLFEKDQRLAEKFSSSVDRVLKDVERFPGIGSTVGGYRRKLVTGFYDFGIFYKIDASRVVIHAILDLRQSSNMIRRRLGD